MKYTYEDLKKSPVGTKITFENGLVYTKYMEDHFDTAGRICIALCEIENMNDRRYGKITKIEEPIYKIVYEVKDILDETEKEWLNHFIKSTKIKVKSITKWLGSSCENEYIEIKYDDYYRTNECLFLPIFKKGTMYKGMKKNKEYTLEELGLED